MDQPDSTEKESLEPCPFLPPAPPFMSYRDLRKGRAREAQAFFETALQYTQYLWQAGLPARSILALCRAVYMDPETLRRGTVQPYRAYHWMVRHYRGKGFLGNPRLSFFNQATRMDEKKALNRMRAWALWHLTVTERPDLPSISEGGEPPPSTARVAGFLNTHGLEKEGEHFLAALEA